MSVYNSQFGYNFPGRRCDTEGDIDESTFKIEVDTDNPVLKSDKEIIRTYDLNNSLENYCYGNNPQQQPCYGQYPQQQSCYGQYMQQQPYYGNNLQQSQIDAVQMKYLDADLKDRINAREHERKKELEFLKNELQKKRIETMEENRKKRDLLTHAVFQNSEGKMCHEIIAPDGKYDMSRPIIQKSHLHMTIFVSSLMEPEEKYAHVEWDGSTRPLVLEGTGFSEKGFLKLLGKNGIAVCISRSQKENFVALVFDYLVDNAAYREVPHTTGWNLLTTGEWIFERDPSKTLRGMFHVLS